MMREVDEVDDTVILHENTTRPERTAAPVNELPSQLPEVLLPFQA